MLTELPARREKRRMPASPWREFRERYWRRKPVVLRKPFGGPLASERELLDCMVRLSSLAAEERAPAGSRIFLGAQARNEPLRHFPVTAADRSLAQYFRRVARASGEKSVCVQVVECQLGMGRELWDRLRLILGGLYGAVGIPAGRVECEIFAGAYSTTPFGVHYDPADVFAFVVEGRKGYRIWSPDAFDGSEKYILDYGSFRGKSTFLEGEPGDVIYWPARFWHVAECSTSTSASLNVSVMQCQGTRNWTVPAPSLPALSADDGSALTTFRFSAEMPPEIRSLQSRAAGALLESLAALEKSVERNWAEKVTGFGFERIPDYPAAPLREKTLVRVDPRFPVLHKRIGDELLVAANGRAFFVPDSAAHRRLLAALGSGKAVRAGDWGKAGSLLRRLADLSAF